MTKTIYVRNKDRKGAEPYPVEVRDDFEADDLVDALEMATKADWTKANKAGQKYVAEQKKRLTDRDAEDAKALVDAGVPEAVAKRLFGVPSK